MQAISDRIVKLIDAIEPEGDINAEGADDIVSSRVLAGLRLPAKQIFP